MEGKYNKVLCFIPLLEYQRNQEHDYLEIYKI